MNATFSAYAYGAQVVCLPARLPKTGGSFLRWLSSWRLTLRSLLAPRGIARRGSWTHRPFRNQSIMKIPYPLAAGTAQCLPLPAIATRLGVQVPRNVWQRFLSAVLASGFHIKSISTEGTQATVKHLCVVWALQRNLIRYFRSSAMVLNGALKGDAVVGGAANCCLKGEHLVSVLVPLPNGFGRDVCGFHITASAGSGLPRFQPTGGYAEPYSASLPGRQICEPQECQRSECFSVSRFRLPLLSFSCAKHTKRLEYYKQNRNLFSTNRNALNLNDL
jgi:hypothetical protein